MSLANDTPARTSALVWVGRVITGLIVLAFTMSGVMKLIQPAGMAESIEKIGWTMKLTYGLGFLELACVLIYAIPRTTILGAILLTGYMGGAIATHVRVSEPPIAQVIFGLLIWLAVYFREPRLRSLIPIRL